jgi:hypothetical protein
MFHLMCDHRMSKADADNYGDHEGRHPLYLSCLITFGQQRLCEALPDVQYTHDELTLAGGANSEPGLLKEIATCKYGDTRS